MIASGLVEKTPCDTDRRGSVVRATTEGRRAIRFAAPGHVAAVRELFIDRLDTDRLAAITGIAQDVLRANDASSEPVPAGPRAPRGEQQGVRHLHPDSRAPRNRVVLEGE